MTLGPGGTNTHFIAACICIYACIYALLTLTYFVVLCYRVIHINPVFTVFKTGNELLEHSC